MATLIFTGATDGDIAKAANWSPAQVPIDGDTLIFDGAAGHHVDTNLDHSGLHPLDLFIFQTFQIYQIGTTAAYLKIGMPTGRLVIGENPGVGTPTGSNLIKLDLYVGSGAMAIGDIIVENTNTSGADTTKPPVLLLADDSDIDLFVRKGKVGLAVDDPAETATFGDVNIGWNASRSSDADVRIGSGVTMTDLYKTGGKCQLNCAGGAVENLAGDLEILGDGAIASLTTRGGTVVPNSTGKITAAYLHGGFTDWTRSNRPRTVDDIVYYPGAQFALDPNVMTITNDIAAGEAAKVSATAL